jgi:lipopolysaccharide biosynthesis glycosyltransferase
VRQSIFIGFDPRETDAFAVARYSAVRRLNLPIPVRGVVLTDLRTGGLYTRPTSRRDGRLWDDISDAPMSTEFACSRFLVPRLAGSGWALFMDADMLVRADLTTLFALADPDKAVMVVKHNHRPPESVKMDGQMQTVYARKNWSSVCLWNVDHPSNRKLTTELINSIPGRDLHRFCWLDDHEIGELPHHWNHLVGEHPENPQAKIVHFTLGTPSMPGYEQCEFADEWREHLNAWALGAMGFGA